MLDIYDFDLVGWMVQEHYEHVLANLDGLWVKNVMLTSIRQCDGEGLERSSVKEPNDVFRRHAWLRFGGTA